MPRRFCELHQDLVWILCFGKRQTTYHLAFSDPNHFALRGHQGIAARAEHFLPRAELTKLFMLAEIGRKAE